MKILIVDDHAVIRAGLKQLCADTGAAVLEADSGDGRAGTCRKASGRNSRCWISTCRV